MTRRLLVPPLLLLALTAVACSGDDDAQDTTTTTAADGQGDESSDDGSDDGSDDTSEDGNEDGSVEGCPTDTAFEIVGTDNDDGAFEPASSLADGGPHPANTVDSDDQNAEFGFASYEIEADPQFGWTIPFPQDNPDGELYFNFRIFSPDGPIEAGQTYIDQVVYDEDPTAADGEINFIALQRGSDRLGPFGDTTVTVTEVTDEVICGEITGVSETELQVLSAIDGSFVAERSQYLESLEED